MYARNVLFVDAVNNFRRRVREAGLEAAVTEAVGGDVHPTIVKALCRAMVTHEVV